MKSMFPNILTSSWVDKSYIYITKYYGFFRAIMLKLYKRNNVPYYNGSLPQICSFIILTMTFLHMLPLKSWLQNKLMISIMPPPSLSLFTEQLAEKFKKTGSLLPLFYWWQCNLFSRFNQFFPQLTHLSKLKKKNTFFIYLAYKINPETCKYFLKSK